MNVACKPWLSWREGSLLLLTLRWDSCHPGSYTRRHRPDGALGVWLFTTNDTYFPGHAIKSQDPTLALQMHASYSLPRRAWLAIDTTWFTGGETRVDRLPSPDLQRNTRVGATLSIPIVSQQSIKFAYSTGAITRRGSDFDSLTATWQLVMF